jgi:two-component system cell cycle sensor histidine kinase/response regulator CckA
MFRKPTYEELKQRVKQLEKEATELSRVEEEFKLERDKLQTLMDGLAHAKIGIDIIGIDYGVLYQNKFLQERFGILTGQLCYEKYMGLKKPCNFCPMIKAVRNNKVESVELAGEDRRNYELISAPLPEPDGTVVKAIEVVRDITDRKQAVEAIRESEERYRNLANSLPQIVFETDETGNLTFTNHNAFYVFGYTEDDFAKGLNAIQMLIPDDQNRAMVNILKVLSGESLGGIEYTAMRKDGSTFPVAIHSNPIVSEGKTKGLRGIIIDLTDRKREEAEKKKLEAQLLRAHKMEALGTLAGGVAHDLNNILSGIVSYPELLLMDLHEDSPLRKPILTIKKSGERAAAIVQDLLTLARRGVVATEVTNLNQIIDNYIKSPECEKLKEFHPGVKIESDLEINLLNVMGSPVHLLKTVMNLVSNAAEAMPDGGDIFISSRSEYIDRPIRGYDDVKEGDYVILSVSDTGVGILPENIERIFEPFYTKKVMGRSGTGLGMAVVWGTVKDHRGYIDVQSTEGKGTTFTIYFPVTRKEITGREEAVPVEEHMGKGESILVVDDVEEQREIASGILKKLGYSVTTVPCGEDAVDYLKDNSADLIVLDMIMDPGIDGLETYKRILELHPRQKAIIASGFSETDRVKEAQRLGAGQYIKKPYTLQKIGLAIKKELDKL